MSDNLLPDSAPKSQPSSAETNPVLTNKGSGKSDEMLSLEQAMQDNLAAIHKVASLVPSLKVLIGLSISTLVILGLYFGQDLLIPLALATLFGFLLNPAVSWLKNKGLPRMLSILVVISVALGILIAGAAYLGMQLGSLSQELPTYQNTIRSKLQNLKTFSEGPSVWDGAISTFTVVKQTLSSEPTPKQNTVINHPSAKKTPNAKESAKQDSSKASEGNDTSPVQEVRLSQNEHGPIDDVIMWLRAIANPIATAGIVLLFVVLILLDRSDLRDRILLLLGSNLNTATDTLDEAAERIGTYLRMQLIVNFSYGIPMALGLWFIGVPAAVLWGMVAVVMRFVPYVGPMLSSIFPLLLAFAVDPSWNMLLWTMGLIVALELISNNIVEPLLYGSSTGLSTLSIIMAATFWTALWGPIGLILSTPLTACLLVLAHYIPALKFFEILLGNTPVLDAPQRFYQRLLADNVEEALELAHADIEQNLPNDADETLMARKITAFYDGVSLPAMRLFSSLHNDTATAEHRLRINNGLKQFTQEMRDEYPAPARSQHPYPRVLCVAARWEVDSKAADMLVHSFQLQSYAAQAWPSPLLQHLSSIDQAQWQDFDVVCVSVFNPQPGAALRLIYRHLRKRWPHLRIMLATWNADTHKISASFSERYGVDCVVDNMQAMGLHLDHMRLQDTAAMAANAPLPRNEEERLSALNKDKLLATALMPFYQEQIQQARSAFDTAYAQISWVDSDWVYTPVSALLPPDEQTAEAGVPREHTVCQYLVQQNSALVIEDTKRDPRFAEQQEFDQRVRFYAGVPLRDEDGMVLGSLCVMDDKPRQISADDLDLLQEMADDLMLSLREHNQNKD